MLKHIINSSVFGLTYVLATLFFHNNRPSGKLPVWLESLARFFISSVIHCLLSLVLEAVLPKRAPNENDLEL